MSNNELLYSKQNGYSIWDEARLKMVNEYSKGYMSFISNNKIEREVVAYASDLAKSMGYVDIDYDTPFVSGGKYLMCNKNKCLALIKVGKNNIENGVRIVISHTDSPRLDLKPNPLYEDSELALMKTHYYGGIKKYQWLTIPLAMHGTIVLQNGKALNVTIGEKDDDPIFYISDLLPHLSKDKNVETVEKAFSGENLNILIGGVPSKDVDKNMVKYNVLNLLNEQYGIVEEDFLSAEIEFVPAMKARDIGIDRAFIGAYGHDDKVCAYSGLTAFLDSNDENTNIMYLVDKEEIGSDGVTGAQSRFIMDVIEKLSIDFNMNFAKLRNLSMCLSADVTSAYDTNFKEVFEDNNSSYLSSGVAINKYTGARGKSGASDATAEFTSYIKRIFNENNVLWQAGEIGKVDVGGGGTVAKYLANNNIDTLDVGVPVMSMHSPYELISKVDLYAAYEGYKSFYNKK